jgi:hypothetical protein
MKAQKLVSSAAADQFNQAYFGGDQFLGTMHQLTKTGFAGVSSGDLEVLRRMFERELEENRHFVSRVHDMSLALMAIGAAIATIRPTGFIAIVGLSTLGLGLLCAGVGFFSTGTLHKKMTLLWHIDLAQTREPDPTSVPTSAWKRVFYSVTRVGSRTGPSA